MKYILNESVFIREEIQVNETVYFAYVGDKDEMYKLNEASYDCYYLIRSQKSIEDICKSLHEKYNMTSMEELQEAVNNIIAELIEIGIIKCEQNQTAS